MKKMLAVLLSLLLLGAVPGVGEEMVNTPDQAAKAYVPDQAQLLSLKVDDGVYKLRYFDSASGEMYKVELDLETLEIQRVKIEGRGGEGSRSVKLTEQQALSVLRQRYPDAQVDFVALTQDDGLYQYEIAFRTEAFNGALALNPETGAVLEEERDYGAARMNAAGQGPLSEEEVRAAVLSRLNQGRITKLKMEVEDGRVIYEGEAVDARYEYEFEVDVMTGRFMEWEKEALREGSGFANGPQPTSSAAANLIGTARAQQRAKEIAGGGQVIKIQLEWEDGQPIYEGEIMVGNEEYEFELDAVTGRVLKWK